MSNVVQVVALLALALAIVAYLQHRTLVRRAYYAGRRHGTDIGIAEAYHRSLTMSRNDFETWCER